jgi:large subunit ribosomal protein L46
MRILDSSCGVNMNTWFVGNHPVGHIDHSQVAAAALKHRKAEEWKNSKAAKTSEESKPAEGVQVQVQPAKAAEPEPSSNFKTFFMKARIMAGQADVASLSGAEDFKWLAKDEIEKVFHPAYWMRVKHMLVEQ